MNQLAFTTAELSREEPYYEASSGLEVSLFPGVEYRIYFPAAAPVTRE